MRSVLVTKMLPAPPNSGGKRRSLAVLERLAARGPTTICAFDDGTSNLSHLQQLGVDVRRVPWKPTKAQSLRGMLRTRSLSAGRFWNTELLRQVQDAAREPIDVLQIEYGPLAPYADGISARTRTLDLHNVESVLFERMAAINSGPRRRALRLEAGRLRALERSAVRTFDLVAVVSEHDRQSLAPGPARVVVCPNGWDAKPEPPPPSQERVAVFVGLLGWGPNADAAVWLGREIWPLVRARVPDARLLLVGRGATKEIRALAGRGIEVVGEAPDVEPFVGKARVATAPLRAGGGSRLKILEALAAGRPVVSTALGAEGLEDLIGKGVVTAEGPARLADALAELLVDEARADELGRRGHAEVRARYSWDTTLRPLFAALDERS